MENSLAQTQNWLRWIITHPKGVHSALEEKDSSEPTPRMLESIIDAPPIPRQVRLDIYAEAYFTRLVEVLSVDFEYLNKVIVREFGPHSFRKMVADYLIKNPSTFKCIGDVGRLLPEFLKNYEFLKELPFLSDLAQLEAVCLETSYYDTLPNFDPTGLSRLDEKQWEDLQFELEPSLQVLEPSWPVHRIWNDEEDLSFRSLAREKVFTLVFRNGQLVYTRPLTDIQAEVLGWMRGGDTLGNICIKLEKNLIDEQEPPPMMEWFNQWISCGVIKNILMSS